MAQRKASQAVYSGPAEKSESAAVGMIIKPSSLAVGVLTATMAIVMAAPGWAKRHRHKAESEGGAGSFDYYLLALSWAPNYCASHPGDHSSECQIGNHKAFVLHGLWPQAESGP